MHDKRVMSLGSGLSIAALVAVSLYYWAYRSFGHSYWFDLMLFAAAMTMFAVMIRALNTMLRQKR